MTYIGRDVRFSLRRLRNNVGSTSILVAILAVGIGSTTLAFSIFSATILHPLPVEHASRLLDVRGAATPPDGDRLAWWSQSTAFASMALYGTGEVNLAADGLAERTLATSVSSTFFHTFQVGPALGRTFTSDEETGGRNQVALISDRLWHRAFAGTPGVLGQRVKLNGRPFTIIGVLPRTFGFPLGTNVWVPRVAHGPQTLVADMPRPDEMVGLLRPGVGVQQAQSDLDALFHRLQAAFGQTGVQFGSGPTAAELQEVLVRNFRPTAASLLVAAGLLLLIACADVSGILLAQAASRRKEIAVRLSLGATRWAVTRQLLIESGLVAFLAGGLGVWLAFCGARAVRAVSGRAPFSAELFRLAAVHVSLGVLGCAFFVSILTGILVGTFPALQSASGNVHEALSQGAFRSTGGIAPHLRNLLAVGQNAVALVLLGAALLMLESLLHLTLVEPGFNTQNVLTMEYDLPKIKYESPSEGEVGMTRKALSNPQENTSKGSMANPNEHGQSSKAEPQLKFAPQTSPSMAALFQLQVLENIERLPGVTAVGAINHLPLSGSDPGRLWFDRGGNEGGMAWAFDIAGDYFRAMQVPVIRGRSFSSRDNKTTTKVVIISQSTAERFWGGQQAVDRSITIGGEAEPRVIVGVVGDIKVSSLGEPSGFQLYLPALQPYRALAPPTAMTLVLRTALDPLALASPAKDAVRSVDSDVPLFNVETMGEVVSRSTMMPQFRGVFFGSFALVALFLAMMGVYGVLVYTVASRTHEFGVRFALGARRSDILLLIFGQGLKLAGAGLAVGFFLAVALRRLIVSLLFGISALPVRTLASSAALLIASVMIACWVPARRASRSDPVTSLRHE